MIKMTRFTLNTYFKNNNLIKFLSQMKKKNDYTLEIKDYQQLFFHIYVTLTIQYKLYKTESVELFHKVSGRATSE